MLVNLVPLRMNLWPRLLFLFAELVEKRFIVVERFVELEVTCISESTGARD